MRQSVLRMSYLAGNTWVDFRRLSTDNVLLSCDATCEWCLTEHGRRNIPSSLLSAENVLVSRAAMEGAPTTLRGLALYRVPHLQGARPEILLQPDLPAEPSDCYWLTLRLSPLSGAHLTPPRKGATSHQAQSTVLPEVPCNGCYQISATAGAGEYFELLVIGITPNSRENTAQVLVSPRKALSRYLPSTTDSRSPRSSIPL